MKTINKNIVYKEVIKKSNFLTFLFPITNSDQAKSIINEYKEMYNDATHVCYSYILDENTYKYYDDGEPSGSAGMPIYQVLKNNKLIYILAIVVRYFGGVKLGVGGLTHAYSSGVIKALTTTEIIEYKKTNKYIIEINYSEYDSLNYFIEKKGIIVLDKQFLDNVFLSIILDDESLKVLKDSFINLNITLIK